MNPNSPTDSTDIISLLMSGSIVVQLVLLLLIGLSIWSWAIVIGKVMQFRRARNDSEEFSHIFWESKNLARIDDSSRRLDSSPLVQVFISGYRELIKLGQERELKSDEDFRGIESALKRAELQQSFVLERGNVFLATVSSAAPFIGLFGTVWGIMNAFMGLGSSKNTTIQAVAPGISEALIATAVGLAAAIPAAVAYNYFTSLTRQFRQSMSAFSSEFLNLAKKTYVR